jgi:transcriptional regulator with XRE-family HTH domain
MARSKKNVTTAEAQARLKEAAAASAFDSREILDFTRALVGADIRRALADTPGMTQKKLAKSIGCSPQNISQVLNERANVTLRTLSEICSALRRHLVVRIIADDEAAPVVPLSTLKEVRRVAQGLPSRSAGEPSRPKRRQGASLRRDS